MRALIFTEGGSQIGFGHISRCSSLYDELKARGVDVEFIVYSEITEFAKDYKVINWLSKDFLTSYIKENDYCIVDSYLAIEELYQVISKRAKRALFIDDNGRIQYPRGIVVNPSLQSKFAYPAKAGTEYLIGPQYVILRSPFINAKRERVNQQVQEVFITLGGADPHHLTPKIVKCLSREMPELTLNVVIGKGFTNSTEIKECSGENVNFHENVTAEEMKRLMLRSDLAITAAGQTIYELIRTGTPFIPIKVADNQEGNILALKELRLVNEALDWNDPLLLGKLLSEVERLLEFRNRKRLLDKYAGVVDGLGSKRIVDALIGGSYER